MTVTQSIVKVSTHELWTCEVVSECGRGTERVRECVFDRERALGGRDVNLRAGPICERETVP